MKVEKEINMIGVILVCSVIGIVFAMIIQRLNTDGILIPMLLVGSTITIGQLMFIVFFIWLIIGVMLGVTLF